MSRSEIVTLAVFGQWSQFPSERAFYRYAQTHLCSPFPSLPVRAQFNRLQREHRDAIVGFGLYLVQLLRAATDVYELLDSTVVVTRDAKRRRQASWLVKLISAGATAWAGMKACIC